MRVLPGSPMMAVAVRGAVGTPGAVGVPMSTMSSAQGPIAATGARTVGPGTGLAGTVGGTTVGAPAIGGAPGGEAGSIEASLQQSQDLSIQYLRIQEEVNAHNREFTAISNVLKAEHDTVKTAIGNIR